MNPIPLSRVSSPGSYGEDIEGILMVSTGWEQRGISWILKTGNGSLENL